MEALRTILERHDPGAVLLLGASDTGKTTLIEQILSAWSVRPIAVVDCDVGQSRLGPPTTVGWGLIDGACEGWPRVGVRGIAFTGAVSPEGNVETFLEAVARMVEAAREAAPRLIVDTTGLVNGELGVMLKRRKIARLKPDLILALQRERELEETLAAVEPPTAVERLPVSAQAQRRTLAERAAYRDRQLARYFAAARSQPVALAHTRLMGLGPDWPAGRVECSPASLLDCVVGLRDAQGADLALGLVRELDSATQRLRVLTPLRDCATVTTLAVGSIRWPTEPAAV